MTPYVAGYKIRYQIPSLQQQAEFAVITASDQIKNEEPSTPEHANRIAWAQWIGNGNSVVGTWPFLWPLAMNPSIQNSVINDPTGATIPDSDVQFVVNSNVDWVVASWVANPPGGGP
jgi:hypothetical protein